VGHSDAPASAASPVFPASPLPPRRRDQRAHEAECAATAQARPSWVSCLQCAARAHPSVLPPSTTMTSSGGGKRLRRCSTQPAMHFSSFSACRALRRRRQSARPRQRRSWGHRRHRRLPERLPRPAPPPSVSPTVVLEHVADSVGTLQDGPRCAQGGRGGGADAAWARTADECRGGGGARRRAVLRARRQHAARLRRGALRCAAAVRCVPKLCRSSCRGWLLSTLHVTSGSGACWRAGAHAPGGPADTGRRWSAVLAMQRRSQAAWAQGLAGWRGRPARVGQGQRGRRAVTAASVPRPSEQPRVRARAGARAGRITLMLACAGRRACARRWRTRAWCWAASGR